MPQLSYTFDYLEDVVRMPNTAEFYQSTFANYNRIFGDAARTIKYACCNTFCIRTVGSVW